MGSEAAAVLEAADFAARKHKGQRRKDPEGTPYINHPIGAEPTGTTEPPPRLRPPACPRTAPDPASCPRDPLPVPQH